MHALECVFCLSVDSVFIHTHKKHLSAFLCLAVKRTAGYSASVTFSILQDSQCEDILKQMP